MTHEAPSFFLAPTLALAATTGSVTLLDGTPIAGAVIKSLTDSVVTTANGSFALGRATGIASRSSKTISVTSHLTVENGHPRLTFAGMDIRGRTQCAVRNQRPLNAAQGSSTSAAAGFSPFAARSHGTQDTLKVYWKGKRLTVLPVASDTSVSFRIDTAWKDDDGIPWNPRISYGSLFDFRDGQTYRTVTIGTQTWMAENLNFSADSAISFGTSPGLLNSRGRGYPWTVAMDLPDSCSTKTCTTLALPKHRGACPVSWHVPSLAEWMVLDMYANIHANPRIGTMLKSSKGWNGTGLDMMRDGTDHYGFRALPTDLRKPDGSFPDHGNYCWWWTNSSGAGRGYADDASMFTLDFLEYSGNARVTKTAQHYLRCLKD